MHNLITILPFVKNKAVPIIKIQNFNRIQSVTVYFSYFVIALLLAIVPIDKAMAHSDTTPLSIVYSAEVAYYSNGCGYGEFNCNTNFIVSNTEYQVISTLNSYHGSSYDTGFPDYDDCGPGYMYANGWSGGNPSYNSVSYSHYCESFFIIIIMFLIIGIWDERLLRMGAQADILHRQHH